MGCGFDGVDELSILKSGDKTRVVPLLNRLNEGVKVIKIHGHGFKLKKNVFQSRDCIACHQLVWHGSQYYECLSMFDVLKGDLTIVGCKEICHKNCLNKTELTCQQAKACKPEEPLVCLFIILNI